MKVVKVASSCGRFDATGHVSSIDESVRVLPNLSIDDGRMETVKDAQGQCHALHDGPGQETVEVELHRIGLHFLHLERLDEPQREVGDEQECDRLSARFAIVLFRRAHPPTRHVRYEEHLRRHLIFIHLHNIHSNEYNTITIDIYKIN